MTQPAPSPSLTTGKALEACPPQRLSNEAWEDATVDKAFITQA